MTTDTAITIERPTSSSDLPIRRGDILRHTDSGEQGVVEHVYLAEGEPVHFGHAGPIAVGDYVIRLGIGHRRIGNCYQEWEHVPRAETSYRQRFDAWMLCPIEEWEDPWLTGSVALLPGADPGPDEWTHYWPQEHECLGMVADNCDEMAARITELEQAIATLAEKAESGGVVAIVEAIQAAQRVRDKARNP